MGDEVSDIVERLRASVTQCRAVDRSELLAEAAAEIERLRLTDAERRAISWAANVTDDGWPGSHAKSMIATLRGLLERMT